MNQSLSWLVDISLPPWPSFYFLVPRWTTFILLSNQFIQSLTWGSHFLQLVALCLLPTNADAPRYGTSTRLMQLAKHHRTPILSKPTLLNSSVGLRSSNYTAVGPTTLAILERTHRIYSSPLAFRSPSRTRTGSCQRSRHLERLTYFQASHVIQPLN